jgi:MFS transporter, AAHS family, 4-hydroxybenzoate transporter
LWKALPESPRYLAARRSRWPELHATLRRIGHVIPEDAQFVEASREGEIAAGGSIRELFSPEFRRDTAGLMGAFSCCLLANYVGFLWIPSMLTDPQVGFSQPNASYTLSLFNFGGVGGALLGALAIQRFGSRTALLTMSGLAVASALSMVEMRLDPGQPLTTMVMFAATGGLLNAVQTTMYALAAHVYPTAIRGTGVGTTVAVGRIGNVLASYVGSWALATGGPPLYFSTWAAAMTIVFVSLAVVRRHIPRQSLRPAPLESQMNAEGKPQMNADGRR